MNDTNGRSKGWGLVTYGTVEEADAARLQLDKAELGGRNITVRFDARPAE